MLPLRPNVCIFLLNVEGAVLVARDRNADPFWRLPQGGVESEEQHQAVTRELFEELGIAKSSLRILYQLKSVAQYEFQTPHPGMSSVFRGQHQNFWAVLFTGCDEEILSSDKNSSGEFNEWRWATISELEFITEPKRYARYQPAIAELVAHNLTSRLRAEAHWLSHHTK